MQYENIFMVLVPKRCPQSTTEVQLKVIVMYEERIVEICCKLYEKRRRKNFSKLNCSCTFPISAFPLRRVVGTAAL